MRTLQVLLILVLLEILDYAQSASFDDVPLQIKPGNWLIEANLYDQSNDKRYSIREMIYSNGSISGKIAITSDTGSFDIFYDSRLKEYRLVIHDNRCDPFTCKSKWDPNLPGIKNPLLNRILLIGPSLIHRLNDGGHRWISASDAQIRGTTMHSDYANMNGNKLRVTRYFKSKEAGQPDRIVFYGTDVTEFATKKQSFIMDFTSFTNLENEVSGLVTITPGIGCRFYLASSSTIPNVPSNQLHYLLVENVKGSRPSSKREEVYADSSAQLLYRKMTAQGKEEETIYDFSLGISHKLLDNGYCEIDPMAPSDPGVEDEKNGHGKYYVYEAVEYNKTTKSGTYDKVVTTHYYIFASIDLGHYYALHSSVINAYKKSDLDAYNLIEKTQRDYYGYGYKISGEMYESIFNIGSCYDSKLKETFALNFKCRSSKESCDYFGKKMPYAYSDELKESIVNTGTISASRIVNIDVFFNQNETTAYVTFNELPPLKNVFHNESIHVAKKVLKRSLEVSVGSSDECLHLYTERATTFEGIAFCENKICASIDKISDLVEDKVDGYDCEIFYVPLKNLNRYDRELSSDAIEKGLKSVGLSFSLYDGVSLAQYTIASISKLSNEIEKVFSPLYTGYKLPGNNIKVQLAKEAENLGDCYHACAKSDACQTFSVCSYSGAFDCLVATFDSATLSADLLSTDESCTVYRRDLVHNYNPVFNRRYKDSTSIVADTHLDNCALLCHQSSQCYSFQFCQGQCSFAGLYTDEATEYHQNCSVYIPKVSDKFIYTGHKIVSETHHTELNLTMDQCAALCDAWKAGDEPCLSFNYCPEGKTESVCSLSKSSAKNPSTRSVVSESCTNYEYKDAAKLNSNPKMDQVKGTSGEAALGIITLFMVVGLVAGITTPIAYRKIKALKIQDPFKIDHSLDEE